ncbi:MFS general substrate transporter [Glarea lozoyensis ATCC 20868]|uniref:MFS general substrate transporter n=1 Tax=Glarea lozoyensis (strain ATCC 20868 / MF5171) TaxID=1116229 RepID=S3DPQ5_GLAL2|nr:MFS general substrate transporter [Glarea lozoyensis ATCC 20868]EPE28443.1 MFS general substrate transporter [Glarea lozoyensis ATCC 20868]
MAESQPKTLQDISVIPHKTEKPPVSSTNSEKANSDTLKSWEKPSAKGRTLCILRTIQRYIWDDPDKSPEEKKFLLKLDFFLLSYGCLGYFCKNLDQANINNAYVSGMKEALSMNGSQLTYASNVFTAGYVISELPAVMLVTRFRPSTIIPTFQVLWSVATFCCASITGVPQLYGLRFLIGFFEGPFFPCLIYVLGSWYTKEERAKRITLFYCTTSLSRMFSGYLQAAAYNNLDGVLGHSGWQWLYIICGIISLPIGILGYFFLPDFPETSKAFYFSEPELEFSRERLRLLGYKPLGLAPWDRKKIFRIANNWQFWVLPFGYFLIQCSLPIQQPAFALWLKSQKKSVSTINIQPTGQVGLAAAVQIAAGMLSDSPIFKGRRWQVIIAMQVGTLVGTIIIIKWNVSDSLKYAGYYLSYICSGVPGLYYSWYPDLIPHDHEMRGFVVASSNTFSFIMQIWWQLSIWRTIEGPRFKNGFIGATAAGVALIILVFVLRSLEYRDDRKREFEAHGTQDIETFSNRASAVEKDPVPDQATDIGKS